MNYKSAIVTAFCASALLVACDFDVRYLNGLTLEDFENDPGALLPEFVVGVQSGSRAGKDGGNGYLTILGIIGREAYNFDPADPRYRTELLETPLNAGSGAFGGNFWTGPYGTLRDTFSVLNVVDSLPYSTQEIAAIKGFIKTLQAQEYLVLVNTRYNGGVALDVNRTVEDELAPLVEGSDAVYQYIGELLDEANADLVQASGVAFPFPVAAGYAGFGTPDTFAQFNRALKARVSVYMEDHAAALEALDESFLTADGGAMNVGPVWVYDPNDNQNDIASNPNIYIHPALVEDAQLKADGTVDDRVTRKVLDTGTVASAPSGLGDNVYSSQYKTRVYVSLNSSIPIIRNEELLLIRAEANIQLGNLDVALDDINLVRQASGGLEPLAELTADSAIDVLLQERKYSLLFEGGHRWIDARRFGRLDSLLDDDPFEGPIVHEQFPIPLAEQNARLDDTE